MVDRSAWQVMGTWASLVTTDADTTALAQAVAAAELRAADNRFSSYIDHSELNRFNRGQVAELSPELREVLGACSWLEQESSGVFTTRHRGSPNEHDVAGYVKGWAVDKAASALDRLGIERFALGVGGDWRFRGGHPDERPWRWGVLDPHHRDRPRAVISMWDGAIATSGTYERGDHLHRGRSTSAPPVGSEMASFTVVGPELKWADAFATIAFLKGAEGLGWVSGYAGYSAAFIDSHGTMLADQAFPLADGSDFPNHKAPYM